ncbi:MAG: SRPBCC family protein [Actinomycetota bacterium]
MIEADASVTIARPIEEVFAFVTDPANDPRWQDDLLEASRSGPVAPGSHVHTAVKFMGRRDIDIEILEAEPPRRLKVQTRSGPPFGLLPLITYELTPAAGGTTFTRRLRMSAKGAGKIMQPMMGFMSRRYNRRFLANLKRVMEGG